MPNLEQVVSELKVLTRALLNENNALRVRVEEMELKNAELMQDYGTVLKNMNILRDKVDAACKLVGALDDLPEDSIRGRMARLEKAFWELRAEVKR